MASRNLPLLAAAAAVAVLPLLWTFAEDAGFAGTDDRATQAIEAVRPDYQPWFTPLWKPPSGEIEGLLFALQASLGAGVLGYYFGLRRGEAEGRRRTASDAPR